MLSNFFVLWRHFFQNSRFKKILFFTPLANKYGTGLKKGLELNLRRKISFYLENQVIWIMYSSFLFIPCCLSLRYFRLEQSMHRTLTSLETLTDLRTTWLCWLRAWEPMKQVNPASTKEFYCKTLSSWTKILPLYESKRCVKVEL